MGSTELADPDVAFITGHGTLQTFGRDDGARFAGTIGIVREEKLNCVAYGGSKMGGTDDKTGRNHGGPASGGYIAAYAGPGNGVGARRRATRPIGWVTDPG